MPPYNVLYLLGADASVLDGVAAALRAMLRRILLLAAKMADQQICLAVECMRDAAVRAHGHIAALRANQLRRIAPPVQEELRLSITVRC